ncbi:MAG: glycosyltransferase [Chloroflexi bacterium]|nr:glycosyltransferase [Chloroflexota bacterium]
MAAHAVALRDAGLAVTIVAGRGSVLPGTRFVRVPLVSTKHPAIVRDGRALARGEITPEHGRLVTRLIRALSPIVRSADRVVVHNALTMNLSLALAEALGALARARRGTFIAWTHDIAWVDPRYIPERHPGLPWDTLRLAIPGMRYVAVSDERADQLAELMRMPRRRVTVVPNGIDLAARLALSAAGAALAGRLGLFDADPLLLLPVRLTRRKRVELAIDAVAALRRRHPRAALVVTGSPGPHNRANRAYAAELVARADGVGGVHLLSAGGGRVSDRVMADLFSLADALVLPSESEGFGIPLLEAGANGVPVVCTDLPTLRAIAGGAATYVDARGDGRAFAAAIERRLAADPVARLRRRAKEHAWPRILREQVVPTILSDLFRPASRQSRSVGHRARPRPAGLGLRAVGTPPRSARPGDVAR